MFEQAIKGMKLYHQVERVFAELRAIGIGDDEPLAVEQLTPFDQYHYLGTRAVDLAIRELDLEREHRVLDVGSGIGGPARYIAARTGCRVTALELQPDLHATAARLTKRCGLDDLVEHLCGDFLEESEPANAFDALVSWLVFLHIPHRETLVGRCFEALKPGGRVFIEDFFELGSLTEQERRDLATKIYCSYLPSASEYRAHLERAGFVGVEWFDMTETWTRFVGERSESYRRNRERHVSVSGAEVFANLDDFYSTVARLFEGGNLGGARITAMKP